jgi:(3S)-malyl-CoA thioesterase
MLPTHDGYPRRSIMFVPASTPALAEKAAKSLADALILDLEDSVAPADKEKAREHLLRILDNVDFGGKKVTVRINALATRWGEEDLQAVKDHDRIDAICIPKIESREEIDAVTAVTSKPIWAFMETSKGIYNIRNIFPPHGSPVPHVEALVLGNNDLSADLGVDDRDGLSGPHKDVVLAARAHGLMVFDGTSPILLKKDSPYIEEEKKAFREDCEASRKFGFDGRCAITPTQLPFLNETFSPTAKQIAKAKRIVDAYTATDQEGGMITVDGQMVEELHFRAAQRILQMVKAIEEKEKAQARSGPTLR